MLRRIRQVNPRHFPTRNQGHNRRPQSSTPSRKKNTLVPCEPLLTRGRFFFRRKSFKKPVKSSILRRVPGRFAARAKLVRSRAADPEKAAKTNRARKSGISARSALARASISRQRHKEQSRGSFALGLSSSALILPGARASNCFRAPA